MAHSRRSGSSGPEPVMQCPAVDQRSARGTQPSIKEVHVASRRSGSSGPEPVMQCPAVDQRSAQPSSKEVHVAHSRRSGSSGPEPVMQCPAVDQRSARGTQPSIGVLWARAGDAVPGSRSKKCTWHTAVDQRVHGAHSRRWGPLGLGR